MSLLLLFKHRFSEIKGSYKLTDKEIAYIKKLISKEKPTTKTIKKKKIKQIIKKTAKKIVQSTKKQDINYLDYDINLQIILELTDLLNKEKDFLNYLIILQEQQKLQDLKDELYNLAKIEEDDFDFLLLAHLNS